MKIPFDIKYKDDILAGRVKVQTERGCDVRIISFDGPDGSPVVGVVDNLLFCWNERGETMEFGFDIVIIKPE